MSYKTNKSSNVKCKPGVHSSHATFFLGRKNSSYINYNGRYDKVDQQAAHNNAILSLQNPGTKLSEQAAQPYKNLKL